ncbi:MAG: translation elongation factor Ts [Candidatus Melainabacteria bacterium]|nr:translation elongation factor Ts [Candidatus Melainabacteria bacterium]
MSTVVEVSASMVKDLREKSGAAMMDCKKALVEALGDFDKAFELLRQKGAASASKKASRATSEGLVVGQVSADGKVASLVEINCETDFVARNDQFVALGKEIAALAGSKKPADVEALLTLPLDGKTVKEAVTETIAKIGENISVKRLAVFDLSKPHGTTGLYIHTLGGKMGAIVEIETDKAVANQADLQAVARELAMHVVSAKPTFLTRDDISAEVIENERRIELGKADLADKKPEMKEKIVTGRVDKLLAERVLSEQPFVKDPQQSVAKYLAAKGKEMGVEAKVVRYALFILGDNGDATEETEASA